MIDFYAPAEQEQVEVFRSPPAAPGTHTIRLRVTGTSAPASAGTAVVIDRIDLAGRAGATS